MLDHMGTLQRPLGREGEGEGEGGGEKEREKEGGEGEGEGGGKGKEWRDDSGYVKLEYSKNTCPVSSSVAQRGLLSAQINYHFILTV